MEKKLKRIKEIKGIGCSTINNIRKIFGINLKKQATFISSYSNILKIKKFLRIKKTTSLLQTLIHKRINTHIAIKSYIGLRHKNGYPVHGQRTHTNSKIQRKLSKTR